DRGAEAPVAARPVRGRAAGRVRADRAGRRHGRARRDADHRPAGRRRVGHQRLKAFITNAGTDITSLITVAAKTGDKEISAFLMPAGSPGLTVGGHLSKVGWCASDTRELFFDSVRVPEGKLLGPRGPGYGQFLQTLY